MSELKLKRRDSCAFCGQKIGEIHLEESPIPDKTSLEPLDEDAVLEIIIKTNNSLNGEKNIRAGKVVMICEGDYLIQGIKSELYVCDKEIFEQSYELLNQEER